MAGRARPRYDDLEAPPRGERGGHGREPDRYASGSSRGHYAQSRYDPRRDDRPGGPARDQRPYERDNGHDGRDAQQSGHNNAGPMGRQGPRERRRSRSPPKDERRQEGGGDSRVRRRSRSPPDLSRSNRAVEHGRADRDREIVPPREQKEERESHRSVPAPRERKEGDEDGEVVVEAQDEDAMMAAMGFASFGTTKGQKVNDPSQLGYAKVKQERTWRQYMNRKGGFNRILEKID